MQEVLMHHMWSWADCMLNQIWNFTKMIEHTQLYTFFLSTEYPGVLYNPSVNCKTALCTEKISVLLTMCRYVPKVLYYMRITIYFFLDLWHGNYGTIWLIFRISYHLVSRPKIKQELTIFWFADWCFV